MTRPSLGSDEGFSLIELAIAGTLALLVVTAAFGLVDPGRGAFQVQLESGDMEQRVRVAVDRLVTDLSRAGAGSYAGTRSGPLVSWFAPILPYRQGADGDDPPGSFTSDRLTLWYVPETAVQTTLSAPIDAGHLTLQVRPEPFCPQGQPLCGFTAGMTVLVFDEDGRYDTFRLTSVSVTSGDLTLNRSGGAPESFASGAKAVQVIERSFFPKTTASGFKQLAYSDGSSNNDVPVIDHLATLAFEYFGESQPPRIVQQGSDTLRARSSYGPAPPLVGERPTAYPPGENCAFVLNPASEEQESRLPEVADAGRRALVPLSGAVLADGDVWCPDINASNRFDVDLLRIRKVVVNMTVESAVDALRGPAGVLFSRPGAARDGRWFLPDRHIRFEVAPPNMGAGR